jgi:hypothetical protein
VPVPCLGVTYQLPVLRTSSQFCQGGTAITSCLPSIVAVPRVYRDFDSKRRKPRKSEVSPPRRARLISRISGNDPSDQAHQALPVP